MLCAILLSGCSWFGGDDDEGEIRPAELVKFSERASLKKQWSVNIGASNKEFWNSLRPAASEELVFSADHRGKVTAIDVATGKRRWSTKLEKPVSGGVGYGKGLVMVGTIEGELLALDTDGSLLWASNVSSNPLAPDQGGCSGADHRQQTVCL